MRPWGTGAVSPTIGRGLHLHITLPGGINTFEQHRDSDEPVEPKALCACDGREARWTTGRVNDDLDVQCEVTCGRF